MDGEELATTLAICTTLSSWTVGASRLHVVERFRYRPSANDEQDGVVGTDALIIEDIVAGGGLAVVESGNISIKHETLHDFMRYVYGPAGEVR